MKRYIGSFIFGVALITAGSLQAQDRQDRDNNQNQRTESTRTQTTVQTQRYYDRTGKDWHNWDDNETHYYQRYQTQNPRYNNQDFRRLKRSQQDQYFRWRHQQHDDNR